MKTFTTTLFLILSCFAFSQVGVGNTNPKASLDISASNTTTPTNEDGILIPRIDNFPTSNPSTDQDGMMVFVTGNGTAAKGFYYWNQATTSWNSIAGAKQINDLTDGKTDSNEFSLYLGADSGINDDDTANSNTGLGYQTLRNNTSGSLNTAIGWSSLSSNTSGSNNIAIGFLSMVSNETGNGNIGIGTSVNSGATDTDKNTIIGNYALFNNNTGSNNTVLGYEAGNVSDGSGNIFLGHRAAANIGSSVDNKLVIENTDADENNALIYGDFGNDSSTTGNVLRTNSEFQIGNPSITGYAFPLADGTINQVMTTDGSGNLTFQDIAGDGDTQNTLDQAYDEGGSGSGRTITVDNGPIEFTGTSGTSYTQVLSNDDAGDILKIISTGIVPQYTSTIAVELENDITTNNSFGNNYGILNKMSVNGTWSNARHIGFRNWFLPAGSTNSQMYGFYNDSQNGGTGDHYGFYNRFHTDAGSGTMYGFYNSINSAHNNTKYGLYSAVVGALGTNYAIYAAASDNSNSWAGFFAGRVELGHNFTNRYFMPGSDGTNGQVMTTDGAGNITFQDSTVNTDNQQIDNFSFNATTNILTLEVQDDGQTPRTVNLSTLQDGTGTDNQQIDNFGLSGTVLGISLEDDAAPLATVDLSSINTDNQQIDNFSFNSSTNVLTLEMENDGQPAQTVDLSNLNPSKSLARITMSANQSLTTSTWQKLNFDTVDFDLNSEFNTTTDEFEISNTGYYRINASWRSALSSVSTDPFGIAIVVNGVIERATNFNNSGNGFIFRSIDRVLALNAGDSVEIQILPTGSLNVLSTDIVTAFEIEQI
ncbi:hypothetical protein [Winogradskyella forsetii]|uniref:hypothetical protein n=1 Tax=Winogradskyella forsetii TaxID=2686077 RepID=UPI0015BBA128|nr:hypothetical protein [Winogradskyella forsetii]